MGKEEKVKVESMKRKRRRRSNATSTDNMMVIVEIVEMVAMRPCRKRVGNENDDYWSGNRPRGLGRHYRMSC